MVRRGVTVTGPSSEPVFRRPVLSGTAVAASALLLSGCGAGTVGADSVQQSVRDGLATQGVEPRTVSCPEGLEASVGQSVICDVELWDETAFGEPVDRIRVVVKEATGDQVRYRLEPLAVGVPDDAPAPDPTGTDEEGS